MTEPMPERTPSEQAYADYTTSRPHPEDEWVRIVRATDPDSPIYDAAVADLEGDHALWAAEVGRVIKLAEAILRGASDG